MISHSSWDTWMVPVHNPSPYNVKATPSSVVMWKDSNLHLMRLHTLFRLSDTSQQIYQRTTIPNFYGKSTLLNTYPAGHYQLIPTFPRLWNGRLLNVTDGIGYPYLPKYCQVALFKLHVTIVFGWPERTWTSIILINSQAFCRLELQANKLLLVGAGVVETPSCG